MQMKRLRAGASIGVLRGAGRPTATVEQPHGFASCLLKFHSNYGTETVMVRALVHAIRPCVRRSEAQQKAAALQARNAQCDEHASHVRGQAGVRQEDVKPNICFCSQEQYVNSQAGPRRASAQMHAISACCRLCRVSSVLHHIDLVDRVQAVAKGLSIWRMSGSSTLFVHKGRAKRWHFQGPSRYGQCSYYSWMRMFRH